MTLALILSFGCKSGTVNLDDSAVEADTDTDTDADSDTDSDTDTDVVPELSFDLSGDWQGSTLTLTRVDLWNDLSLGEVIWEGEVDATPHGIVPDVPEASVLGELDPEGAPGMLAAFYVPTLTRDDEVIAVGETWALYVTGNIPAEYNLFGIYEGWNAWNLDITGQTDGYPGDPLAIPVEPNITLRESIAFAGTYTGPDTVGLRLTLIPSPVFDGMQVAGWLYDQALGRTFAANLSGRPPQDHFSWLDGVGEGAMEVPIAYEDVDGNQHFGANDTPVGGACIDGVPVSLIWLDRSPDIETALILKIQGLQPGWIPIKLADGGGLVGPDEIGSLVIDGSCSL